jgi:hypothetical protein
MGARLNQRILAPLVPLLAVLAMPLFASVPPPATDVLVISHTRGYAVYGDTETIRTDLQATTERPLAGTVRFWNCGVGPEREMELPRDSSAILHDFGKLLCGPRVGVVAIDATNAIVTTFPNFNAPGRPHTGFEVPLLTEPIGKSPMPTEARLLTNPRDRSYSTTLLLFNVSSEPAWVTATVYDDAHPEAPVREYILVRPGGELTWYDVETWFDTGRIELSLGVDFGGWGCFGCDREVTADIYGFAAIGTPSGDAPRVRPFHPKLGISVWLPTNRTGGD